METIKKFGREHDVPMRKLVLGYREDFSAPSKTDAPCAGVLSPDGV
ncbi:MAG: hypothetical protein ACRDNB_03325 [Gaiellaceae bacterium]